MGQRQFEAALEEAQRVNGERMCVELTQSLTQSLSVSVEEKCRASLESEFEERMASEMEGKKVEMQAMEVRLEGEIKKLAGEMEGRERVHREEMQRMERSKCELIGQTAKEIDSLRGIIKTHFQQIAQLQALLDKQQMEREKRRVSQQSQSLQQQVFAGLNIKWG